MNWKEYDRQKFYLQDARELGDGYGNWKIAAARENYLRGMYDYDTYVKVASGGQRAVEAERQKQIDLAVAKSQAKVAGQVAADRAHWANVIGGNYDAKNPGHNFSDDIVTAPKEHGYAADNIMKMVNTYKNNS